MSRVIKIKGRSIKELPAVAGKALVTTDLVAFWAGTDWETGEIVEVGHQARGQNMSGKILVCPAGKGGAGDTFGYYYLYRSGKAPRAIICNRAQGTTLAGALLTNTPMLYGFGEDVTQLINTGDQVEVNPKTGEVIINRKDD
jgi:predicted aconitase with swiveling domain